MRQLQKTLEIVDLDADSIKLRNQVYSNWLCEGPQHLDGFLFRKMFTFIIVPSYIESFSSQFENTVIRKIILLKFTVVPLNVGVIEAQLNNPEIIPEYES